MTAIHDGSGGLAIYIHWPFCVSKCPYCDFNSHVREHIDETRWRRALIRELTHFAGLTGGMAVGSVFFGGGTPSLMQPLTVEALLDAVVRLWRVDAEAEITLEANPGSAEAERFRGLRAAGVNRISLGVQALDDRALRALGRRHDVADALAALSCAQATFERVSCDLIYARPGQGLDAWERELGRALSLGTSHLSLYQLTIEEGTAFHGAWRRGELELPSEDVCASFYELTDALTRAAGLPAYEISNHARPGEECRHNLIYWRGGAYVGVGAGAHGRLGRGADRVATRQHRAPEAWLASVERDGHATREWTPIPREIRLQELMMMGLRTAGGVSRSAVRETAGGEVEEVLPAATLRRLVDGDLLELDDRGLRATPAGRLVLNAVLGELLT